MPMVRPVGIDPVHFGLVLTSNGDRAADAAGGERPDRRLLDRQGRRVGGDQVNICFIGVLFLVLMLVTYVPMIALALVECSIASPERRLAGWFGMKHRSSSEFAKEPIAERLDLLEVTFIRSSREEMHLSRQGSKYACPKLDEFTPRQLALGKPGAFQRHSHAVDRRGDRECGPVE